MFFFQEYTVMQRFLYLHLDKRGVCFNIYGKKQEGYKNTRIVITEKYNSRTVVLARYVNLNLSASSKAELLCMPLSRIITMKKIRLLMKADFWLPQLDSNQ